MPDLNQFGLPVKYDLIGAVMGVIWLIVRTLFGWESDSGPLLTLLAFTGGGFAGGALRQWAGKTD